MSWLVRGTGRLVSRLNANDEAQTLCVCVCLLVVYCCSLGAVWGALPSKDDQPHRLVAPGWKTYISNRSNQFLFVFSAAEEADDGEAAAAGTHEVV